MSRVPRPVRLTRIAALTPQARHLVLEVADEEPFEFEPGQHVCLSTTLNGERIDRYYSIASAPEKPGVFELCIKPVGDGSALGDYLAQVEPGATFECTGPGGSFRLASPVRDAVFLAAGTGITPLRAMLRRLLAEEGKEDAAPQLTLIFGARTPQELYFQEEFQALAESRPNFRFWPTVSGPAGDWPGRTGRVQQHLEEALGNRFQELDVYLCGPKEMVSDVRAALAKLEFDERALHYERYG